MSQSHIQPPPPPMKVGDRYLNVENGAEAKIDAVTENYVTAHYRSCVAFVLNKQRFNQVFERILEGMGKNPFAS